MVPYYQYFYNARRAWYFWFALYLRGKPKEKNKLCVLCVSSEAGGENYLRYYTFLLSIA
jgi:hypothetical protein